MSVLLDNIPCKLYFIKKEEGVILWRYKWKCGAIMRYSRGRR